MIGKTAGNELSARRLCQLIIVWPGVSWPVREKCQVGVRFALALRTAMANRVQLVATGTFGWVSLERLV